MPSELRHSCQHTPVGRAVPRCSHASDQQSQSSAASHKRPMLVRKRCQQSHTHLWVLKSTSCSTSVSTCKETTTTVFRGLKRNAHPTVVRHACQSSNAHLWVEVDVVQHHSVCARQVQALAAGACGEQKDKHAVGRVVEAVNQRQALLYLCTWDRTSGAQSDRRITKLMRTK